MTLLVAVSTRLLILSNNTALRTTHRLVTGSAMLQHHFTRAVGSKTLKVSTALSQNSRSAQSAACSCSQHAAVNTLCPHLLRASPEVGSRRAPASPEGPCRTHRSREQTTLHGYTHTRRLGSKGCRHCSTECCVLDCVIWRIGLVFSELPFPASHSTTVAAAGSTTLVPAAHQDQAKPAM